MRADPVAKLKDPLLMAGRAKIPAFTGKGEQLFRLTLPTLDPGEALGEVAAVQELLHDFAEHRPREPVPLLIGTFAGCPVPFLGSWPPGSAGTGRLGAKDLEKGAGRDNLYPFVRLERQEALISGDHKVGASVKSGDQVLVIIRIFTHPGQVGATRHQVRKQTATFCDHCGSSGKVNGIGSPVRAFRNSTRSAFSRFVSRRGFIKRLRLGFRPPPLSKNSTTSSSVLKTPSCI